MNDLRKPSYTARKKTEKRRRAASVKHERDEKMLTRRRDGYRCRFPICGCRALGLRIEAAHGRHKGMGGDPKGHRSKTDDLIMLCVHRHQTGDISIHKGTLRWRYLTGKKADGPIAWDISVRYNWQESVQTWMEVAREAGCGLVESRNIYVLKELARMEV